MLRSILNQKKPLLVLPGEREGGVSGAQGGVPVLNGLAEYFARPIYILKTQGVESDELNELFLPITKENIFRKTLLLETLLQTFLRSMDNFTKKAKDVILSRIKELDSYHKNLFIEILKKPNDMESIGEKIFFAEQRKIYRNKTSCETINNLILQLKFIQSLQESKDRGTQASIEEVKVFLEKAEGFLFGGDEIVAHDEVVTQHSKIKDALKDYLLSDRIKGLITKLLSDRDDDNLCLLRSSAQLLLESDDFDSFDRFIVEMSENARHAATAAASAAASAAAYAAELAKAAEAATAAAAAAAAAAFAATGAVAATDAATAAATAAAAAARLAAERAEATAAFERGRVEAAQLDAAAAAAKLARATATRQAAAVATAAATAAATATAAAAAAEARANQEKYNNFVDNFYIELAKHSGYEDYKDKNCNTKLDSIVSFKNGSEIREFLNSINPSNNPGQKLENDSVIQKAKQHFGGRSSLGLIYRVVLDLVTLLGAGRFLGRMLYNPKMESLSFTNARTRREASATRAIALCLPNASSSAAGS